MGLMITNNSRKEGRSAFTQHGTWNMEHRSCAIIVFLPQLLKASVSKKCAQDLSSWPGIYIIQVLNQNLIRTSESEYSVEKSESDSHLNLNKWSRSLNLNEIKIVAMGGNALAFREDISKTEEVASVIKW
ncbi:hypothetical protein Tco_1113954 [Tanacetum coccineum]|uniref:Uncharacterized protein n=1 Tax=Tanacetum coccineum TaxID=301880 RepID=A0ABQ5IU48_9ASTR